MARRELRIAVDVFIVKINSLNMTRDVVQEQEKRQSVTVIVDRRLLV